MRSNILQLTIAPVTLRKTHVILASAIIPSTFEIRNKKNKNINNIKVRFSISFFFRDFFMILVTLKGILFQDKVISKRLIYITRKYWSDMLHQNFQVISATFMPVKCLFFESFLIFFLPFYKII